jgi:S-DNA-T family DNA segregation ATPase FtsK/SpoIIIE
LSRRALIVPSDDELERTDDFELPELRLLTPAPERRGNPELSDTALGRKAELLHGVLEDFGVKGGITGVHPGPVITLFELEPARGTKSSRVIGLADDIARSMSAVSARVAVIPGRDAIGIELPNQNRETVFLRELLESPEFAKGKAALPLALGKTISGLPVIADLARMPHLLIAGTTGSGKSVAINAMILSLLYKLSPEQCRFILIDPKMLELSVYDDIPHLLTPVVTDPRKAIAALKWTVGEMNVRYERMCKLGVRNITGFNQKVARARLQGRPLTRTVQTGFDDDTGDAIYEREEIDDSPMPYIVVVIDEMADLMMVAGKDIEYAVQRLSQMARAAGIHLIMATQRPSVDVITGTIKANFPSRISFQVTSKIDSRTILGEQGAEQLLGAGDMLSMAAGGRIMRSHGPFVSDEEVERVVNFLREQAEPDYLDGVLDDVEPAETKRGKAANSNDVDLGREPTGEALYDQAVEIVIKERRATTSYLQRRLGIGYNRAASLIERMEEDGLISPPNRTGKREIRGSEGA